MSYTPEQANFARDVIANWCDRWKLSPRQVAENEGVSGDRMEQFMTGALPALDPSERQRLAPLFEDCIQAEEAEERDHRLHPSGELPRHTKAILAEHMNR